MTSYSTTSSDMTMHEHTRSCKQAGRWRSSESVRREDTHRNKHTHTHTQTSLSPYTSKCKAFLSTILTISPDPFASSAPLIALDIFFVFPWAHALFQPRRCQRHPRTSRLFGSYALHFAHVPVAGETTHLAWPSVRLWEKILRIGLG